MSALIACPCCGLVQGVPAQADVHTRLGCVRCRSVLPQRGVPRDNMPAAMCALAALLLWPASLMLPVVRIERLGAEQVTSIWQGTMTMLADGHLFIGVVVLVCSIVVPLLKLCALLALARPGANGGPTLARTHRWVEALGRWGMVDVLVVAVLVATLKLGDLVHVEPGPGIVLFGVSVMLSLVAGALFDPRALWQQQTEATA